MEYSKQVEVLFEKIAIFAIESKNCAPNSIMYNIERTRLMESALALQLTGRRIDSQLQNRLPIPNVEIGDFKHEFKCIEETLNTLTLQLEVEVNYAQKKSAVNSAGTAGLGVSNPDQLRKSPEGRALLSPNLRYRPIPVNPATPENARGPPEPQPESPCLCPRCAVLLYPTPNRSEQSSICSYMPSKHIRNRGVESVIESRSMSCPYKTYGCQVETKHDPMDCLFAVRQFCGYLGFPNCPEAVSRENLLHHLMQTHLVEGELLDVGETIEMCQGSVPLDKIAKTTGAVEWKPLFFVRDDKICHIRTTLTDSRISWKVSILGSREIASKYFVKMKLLPMQECSEGMYYKYEGLVNDIKTGKDGMGAAFSLSVEQIKSVCSNGDSGPANSVGWKLRIRVLKKCDHLTWDSAKVNYPRINNTIITTFRDSPVAGLPLEFPINMSNDGPNCEMKTGEPSDVIFLGNPFNFSSAPPSINYMSAKQNIFPRRPTLLPSAPVYRLPGFPPVRSFPRPPIPYGIDVVANLPRSNPLHNHQDIPCEGCKHLVGGNRYKCVDCNDFNVCSACVGSYSISSIYAHSHIFLMFYADSNEERLRSLFQALKIGDNYRLPDLNVTCTTHGGVTCDACGTSPIRGPRHKCIYCDDYDLCLVCASARAHGSHDIFMICPICREEMPARAVRNRRMEKIAIAKVFSCTNEFNGCHDNSRHHPSDCEFETRNFCSYLGIQHCQDELPKKDLLAHVTMTHNISGKITTEAETIELLQTAHATTVKLGTGKWDPHFIFQADTLFFLTTKLFSEKISWAVSTFGSDETAGKFQAKIRLLSQRTPQESYLTWKGAVLRLKQDWEIDPLINAFSVDIQYLQKFWEEVRPGEQSWKLHISIKRNPGRSRTPPPEFQRLVSESVSVEARQDLPNPPFLAPDVALKRARLGRRRVTLGTGIQQNEIHDGGIICDCCKTEPIVGPRYKCIECDNFDLCSTCVEAHDHAEHVFLVAFTRNQKGELQRMCSKFKEITRVEVKQGIEDFERQCDGCGEDPLLEPCYSCTICENYDLCQCCINDNIHSHHVFLVAYSVTALRKLDTILAITNYTD
ncbi:unnamed protein product [Allacma fusca]|uniref:ZZ-type domain-containing protein n=1 Tax=Allacma fusca TaxID=39272 RepID=A0A8J2KU78_9HEXA|nr:unnamed protein product [Allacma fusca]